MSVNNEIKELSKKIEDMSTIDKAARHISSEKDPYMELRPEVLTEEVLNAKAKYDKEFVAAGTLAFGRMSQQLFKEDKAVETVTGQYNLGVGANIELDAKRRVEFNAAPGSSEKVAKFGTVVVKMNTEAGRAKSGDLAKVRKALEESGKDLLGDK